MRPITVDYIADEYKCLRSSGVSHFVASRRAIDLWRIKKKEVNTLFELSNEDDSVVNFTESKIYVNEVIRNALSVIDSTRYFVLNENITITTSKRNRDRLYQLLAFLLYREDIFSILDIDLEKLFSERIREFLDRAEYVKSVILEYQDSDNEVDKFRALLIENTAPDVRRMIDVSDAMGMKRGTRGLGLEFSIFLNVIRNVFRTAIKNTYNN